MKSHELKEKIVKSINESNLPIDAVYYVLKEVVNSVSLLYNEELNNQNQEIENERKDGEE